MLFRSVAASGAAPVQTVSGRAGNVTLTKSDVGLSNVDNTSDINKPVSTAQAAANSAVQSAAASDATTKANAAQAYSIQRSNHTGSQLSSTISDFSTSVSGLLPVTNILGGANINVSSSGSVYTVGVSGQLGLTSSQVDSRVVGLLTAGTGINLSYDNINNQLTITSVGFSSSGNYALANHTHTTSQITDFASAVSGLLPVKNISGSEYVNIISSNGNYTIGVTGLQPSGNYSAVGHTHTSANITDFASSVSGLLPVTNIIGGTNISVVPSGTNYRVSVSGLSTNINIGNGTSSQFSFNTLSDTLNIVGSGSTSVSYNNTTKTVSVNTPQAIKEYELVTTTKSTFTVTGGYSVGNLDVYHNGIKLVNSQDYTATNGSSFVLNSNAINGDVVEWTGYSSVPKVQLLLGEVRSDYVGSTNYIGTAVAGSSESSNVWRIKKYVISDDGVTIATTTAGSVAWANRLSVTYS